jgi:hypothetical protein
VHGKHGGPKKQLNCPHPNCKRHTGKGFSRQENLNEHLRRVHTDGAPQDGEATEEEEELKQGLKRKRVATGGGRDDVREELKRLRIENDDLRRNLEVQTAQTTKMMQQIAQVCLRFSLPLSNPLTFSSCNKTSSKLNCKPVYSSTPVCRKPVCSHNDLCACTLIRQ